MGQITRYRVGLNWLFNVTINDISVIYVTAHRCAGGLKKKLDLRSGSERNILVIEESSPFPNHIEYITYSLLFWVSTAAFFFDGCNY